jgi:tRNA1Val (adenine37-N6)-methyltransferase
LSNNYFQFKQFRIEQEKSSMKVCTDSCLFGAWIAGKLEQNQVAAVNLLDIGAGTGLLSLMIAQEKKINIDALEIDEHSFHQSNLNFIASPWAEKLKVFHEDVKNWNNPIKYELIISNPPFYENDLKATKHHKNVAKHNDGLTFEELIRTVKVNLATNGKFAVLLPYHRVAFFKQLASGEGLFLEEELLVKQTPKHNWFRGVLLFGQSAASPVVNQLTIKNREGKYTKEFDALLKEFYLD